MIISFTGHRNAAIDPAVLSNLAALYPSATWAHGNARGADSEVAEFAVKAGIKQLIVLPDYNRHGRGAPFVRNRILVDSCDMLVAFYDNRKTGGTAYTVNYARQRQKRVHIIPVQATYNTSQ